ncbi:energy transducer TonB [Erythrobacter crassostreae]|uniref:Energy transducer TonB n=1 Tax=Erythrobacter crassostreae TaxID=2828328 RepID=A0A9X1F3W0_9SPHN|nr:energy transducer TonB [Erythrobacter crassostrea]MBV7259018.1 energy transducer TonB [Erythrobacter crassostrea]
MTHAKTRYSGALRRPRWWVIALIVLLHLAALYGLGRALAPEFTGSVEETVVSAFTVTITAPPDPPPPENDPEPDEGAQGDLGREAVPQPVTAPKPKIETKPSPKPQASSTGTANRSGARAEGDGTGAAGSGTGTGRGNQGGGQGGVAVTKPVHISGAIQNARDYPVPAGGREARRGTEVIVRVVVGVDGRARQCSIYRPSPDAEADRITCNLVENRLRFRPATDRNGNAVAAPFYWRQRWF